MSLASLEHEEVKRFTHRFEALFDAGDAAGMASFYTEDAKLLAENADLVQGRAAIEQFWQGAISRARAASAVRTISLHEVTSSGDLGYALGTVVVRIPAGRELTTKYATIWQRDADGRWRLAVDSSSPNPPANAPDRGSEGSDYDALWHMIMAVRFG
jgi:uncharacterized protein (TIGR02246 family)